MRVLTESGRMVSVAGPGGAAGARFPAGVGDLTPPYASGGPMRLLKGSDGRRPAVRYAVVARANPWVAASVNERAGLASRVPIHVFRPDPEGREGHRERVRPGDGGAGDRLAQLLEHPEPRVSARRFRRRVAGDWLVHGNALAEKVRSGGEVIGLTWHPWADVVPVLSKDGLRVEVFKVPVSRSISSLGFRTGVSETRPVDPADAVHFTIGDDTESPLGVSPLSSLHATHALHDAAWQFARAYLEEGMFPSGVVELPEKATMQQAQLTRELLEEINIGVARGGKPAIIGWGKWHQVMATPDGAKLVELAKMSREEISAAYRMAWLGNIQQMNRATANAARQAFIRDVVGEDVGIFEDELNAQLVAPQRRWSEGGVFVESQLGELLRPDLEALSQVIRREVGAPVLTPNEGRGLLNYPPLDDEDANRLILNPGTPEGDDEEPAPRDDEDERGE